MRSGRAGMGGDRQAQDLDQDRPLGADRPATAATGRMERRAVAGALHGLASTMTIDGLGSRSWSSRTTAARRAIARSQTPFARQRRHWAQTAV